MKPAKPLVSLAFIFSLCLTLPTFSADSADNPAQARLAVASNFSSTIKILLLKFNNEKYQIEASHGSTGKLFAQLKNGAPYDVFLSADELRADKLVQSGLAEANSGFIYAQGQLALWAANKAHHPVGPNSLNSTQLRLAIANPKLAPYGSAADSYLKQSQKHPLKKKPLQGENISQAYQFVASGNADFGLLALSQLSVSSQPNESWWLVPSNLYSPINQKAVLTKHGRKNPAAIAFLKFLRSPEAINIIKQNGYSVVNEVTQ